jgi:hypothetical protein
VNPIQTVVFRLPLDVLRPFLAAAEASGGGVGAHGDQSVAEAKRHQAAAQADAVTGRPGRVGAQEGDEDGPV